MFDRWDITLVLIPLVYLWLALELWLVWRKYRGQTRHERMGQ